VTPLSPLNGAGQVLVVQHRGQLGNCFIRIAPGAGLKIFGEDAARFADSGRR
jgi:hypothetical protein